MGTFGVGGGGGGFTQTPQPTTQVLPHPVQGTPPTVVSGFGSYNAPTSSYSGPVNNTTMVTPEQQFADFNAANGGDWIYAPSPPGSGGTIAPGLTGSSLPRPSQQTIQWYGLSPSGGLSPIGGGGSRNSMPQGGAAGSDRPRWGAQPIPGHQGSTGVSGGGSRAYNPNNNSGMTVEPGHAGFKGGTFNTGGGGYSQYGQGGPVQGGSFGIPQGQSIYGQGQPQEERFKPFATLGGMIKGLFS